MTTRAESRAASLVRTEKMAEMYRQGVTMAKIGSHYGLTRERVRQCLSVVGIAAKDGGRSLHGTLKGAKAAQREARYLAKYGFAPEVMTQLRQQRVTLAYGQQRRNSLNRGIAWEISFFDWVALWLRSGKWEQRGRGAGRYVMSRIRDDGPYKLGNVHIQLSTENNSEFRRRAVGRKSEVTGVYCMYPGTARPWVAMRSKKRIGAYATKEEAIAARAEFMANSPKKLGGGAVGRGRGYFKRRVRERTYYVVRVCGKYVGCFRAEDDARNARAAALVAHFASSASHPTTAQEG